MIKIERIVQKYQIICLWGSWFLALARFSRVVAPLSFHLLPAASFYTGWYPILSFPACLLLAYAILTFSSRREAHPSNPQSPPIFGKAVFSVMPYSCQLLAISKASCRFEAAGSSRSVFWFRLRVFGFFRGRLCWRGWHCLTYFTSIFELFRCSSCAGFPCGLFIFSVAISLKGIFPFQALSRVRLSYKFYIISESWWAHLPIYSWFLFQRLLLPSVLKASLIIFIPYACWSLLHCWKGEIYFNLEAIWSSFAFLPYKSLPACWIFVEASSIFLPIYYVSFAISIIVHRWPSVTPYIFELFPQSCHGFIVIGSSFRVAKARIFTKLADDWFLIMYFLHFSWRFAHGVLLSSPRDPVVVSLPLSSELYQHR